MQVLTNKPKMSQLQTELTARALIGNIKDFFDNPENEAKFEKWRAEKEGNNGKVNTND